MTRCILASSVVALLGHLPARAASIFWDGSGTDWNLVGDWSTVATGLLPDPSAVPGASDIAIFDASSATVAQTVNLNSSQSVLGLATNSSNLFATALLGGSGNQVLTLGTSGISHLGGGLTIGSAAAGQQVAISLQGSQSWDSSTTGTGAAGLQILNGVSIGAGGNQTLTLTGTGATTTAGTISGAITDGTAVLSLAKTGTGSWILTGANSYTGTTTISNGVVQIQNASALGTTDNGTSVSSGGALQLTGGIAVTGEALSLAGDGAASSTGALHGVAGNNAWTGNITIQPATTTRVVNDAGTLTLSGNITLSTNSTDQFVVQGNGNGAITGNISGSSRVTHSATGTGAWVLSGTNTYAGGTSISNGTIQFAQRVSLYNGDTSKWLASAGVTAGFAVNASGTLALNVGGTGEFTSSDVATLFDATHLGLSNATNGLQPSATFALDTTNAAGGTFSLSANLVNPGGNLMKFNKLGTGILDLAGTNTYTGATTITAGTLAVSGTLGATSISVGSGVFLQLKNTAALNSATLTLAGGTLQLRSDNNSDTFGTASATMSSNSTINVDQLATGTNNTLGLSALSVTNTVSVPSATVTITGGNGYGLAIGSITQASTPATTLTIANSAPLTIGSFTTNSTATPKLSFTGLGTTTITGNITQGTVALALDRSSTGGTLILQGTSNMTGAVTITNGTIQTAVATNAFGSTSGISIGANGTLALRSDVTTAFGNGTTSYPVALTATGGTINVDQATAAGTGQTITLGTVSLPGVFTLNVTGANNTSLTLPQVNGSGGNATINNSITGGGILKIIGFTQTDAATHTLTFGGSGNTTVNSQIQQNGANALSLTYNGTGKLTLNGDSTYTGVTTIANGTLSALDLAVSGSSSALGNANSAVVLGATSTKGTLAYPGIGTTFTRGFTVAAGGGEVDVTGLAGFQLTIAGGAIAIASGATFTSGGVGDTGIGSAITGTGGKVVKNDTGALTLAGANTFSGGLTLNAGTLNVNSPTALGTGTFTINGGTLNNSTGVAGVQSNNFNKVFNASFTYGAVGGGSDLALGGATSTVSTTTTITSNIAITTNNGASLFVPCFTLNGGTNTLTKLGTGTLAFGSNTNADTQSGTIGDTTVSAGTLIFAAGGATPAGYTVGNVSVGISGVFAIGTGNSGTVVPFTLTSLSGAGTVTTENTFTTGAGRRSLIVGNNGGSGTFTGSITEGSGGDGTLSLSKNGSGTQVLSGMDTYTGNTVINAGTLQFGKRFALYNGDITKWVAKASTISGTTTQGLYVASGATLGLSVGGTGEFSTSDITTLLNGTHLGASTATAGLQNGSALGLDTTNAAAGIFTYSSAITNFNSGANAIGVTKLGNGTLELAATNTYTGATTVKSGTILVSGSISGSSPVTVGDAANLNTTAVLGGAGTVGSVTVGSAAGNTGATLNPHAGSTSTGAGTTLNTGAVTFADSAAHLSLEIGRTSAFTAGGGTGTAGGDVSDHLSATGAVTLNGADLQLSLLTTTGYTIAQNDVFFLILNGSGGAVNGTFASLNGTATSLGEGTVFTFNSQFYEITYQASFAGNSFTGGHDVALLAVPEPRAATSLLGGFALLLGLRRKRTR